MQNMHLQKGKICGLKVGKIISRKDPQILVVIELLENNIVTEILNLSTNLTMYSMKLMKKEIKKLLLEVIILF